jgi:hypothetical protein
MGTPRSAGRKNVSEYRQSHMCWQSYENAIFQKSIEIHAVCHVAGAELCPDHLSCASTKDVSR